MRCTRRTMVGLAGITATVLLHSILFAVAVWEGGGLIVRPLQPDSYGGGANTGKPDGDLGERLITVALMPEFEDVLPIEPPPQLLTDVMVQPSALVITGLDALPLPPIDVQLPGEDAADEDAALMAHARFAGIYEGQVRARILRAWSLPDEPAPSPDFSCLVKILQRPDGRVREVDFVLDQCNGSGAWQKSLSDAIFRASPLPAPPHPSAFVDSFALVFHSSAAESRLTSAK